MEVIIQSLGFKASEQLENFAGEKLEKLEPLNHNIIRANVTLFQDAAGTTENNYCEIRLEAPGNDPFVKKHAESFEQSISEAVDALQSILRKNKEKLIDQRHAG
jgi:putative sigma-54 modulation protein